MSANASLLDYLLRDSLQRWRGRVSVPLARLAVAGGLSTAALLVLASFAFGVSALESRIAQFGLDSLVVRTPLRRVSDPTPAFPTLARQGRVLTLMLPYATAGLDTGGHVALAMASEGTLPELAALEVSGDHLPLLITSALPAGMPVRASLGPWSTEARTALLPAALRPLGLNEVLVVRPGDFPMQAMLPGTALTLFVRSPAAAPLERIVAALTTVFANNPAGREGAPVVQSALPFLQEMAGLQSAWRGYAALLAAVLAATIALVYGSGSILEYEVTAYTTALLRSFGVARFQIWLQRYAEAALLANAGGALALAAAFGVARLALTQLTPHLCAAPVLLPVFAALNAGALAAALPVAAALRRPVGMILQ